MQTNPNIIAGNLIASIDLEPDSYWSDNIGIALVSYFENHTDCPEDSPIDDERGEIKWQGNYKEKFINYET